MWVLGARNTTISKGKIQASHVENGYAWDLNTGIKTLGKTGGGTSPKLAIVTVVGFSLLDHIRFVI